MNYFKNQSWAFGLQEAPMIKVDTFQIGNNISRNNKSANVSMCISFSLYLIHPIVLSFLPMLIRALGFTVELSGWGYFAFALLAILLCSAMSYQLIEKNLNRLARRI